MNTILLKKPIIRDVIPNRSKDCYKNNKERLRDDVSDEDQYDLCCFATKIIK